MIHSHIGSSSVLIRRPDAPSVTPSGLSSHTGFRTPSGSNSRGIRKSTSRSPETVRHLSWKEGRDRVVQRKKTLRPSQPNTYCGYTLADGKEPVVQFRFVRSPPTLCNDAVIARNHDAMKRIKFAHLCDESRDCLRRNALLCWGGSAHVGSSAFRRCRGDASGWESCYSRS